MVPATKNFEGRIGDTGDMDKNFFFLADAIQSTDTLFKQFGVGRQIDKHQMLTKLKVPSFAAALATDKQSRTIGTRKPGGIAVALQDGH